MIDVTDIEKRIDRAIAAPTPVDGKLGGLALENLGQVMEFAKLMAVSGIAVPKWLRNNPGGCLAICSRALRWGMDPFAVAEKSYMAVGKGGVEHVGYEAQLVHAVITAHAPLKGRLRSEIIGTGDERRCKVWGTFKGETKPHEYTSETLGKKIKDIGYNDKGQLKGSPLWLEDPEVQLTYSAVRQWCRLHSSETLLGVYAQDELEAPLEVSPTITSLAQRLKDAKHASVDEHGFDAAHVAREVAAHSVIEHEEQESETSSDSEQLEHAIRDKWREVAADHRPVNDRDKKGRGAGGEEHKGVRPRSAGQRAAPKEGTQGEIFPRTPPRNPPQEDRPDSPRGYVSKPKVKKDR